MNLSAIKALCFGGKRAGAGSAHTEPGMTAALLELLIQVTLWALAHMLND